MKPLTPDAARMCFGFLLLTILVGLALSIALGHVEERTSYGLMPLLMGVSNLATQFASWAFSKPKSKDDE